jgi:hypothetical protein
VLGDLAAVDQQRDRVEGRQVLSEQLVQGPFGGGDEPARDCDLEVPVAVCST